MSSRNLTQRIVAVNQGIDKGADIIEAASDAGAFRIVGGTGTLVTGAVTIATGLNGVNFFTAQLTSSGVTATGATEVDTLRATPSLTTGAVAVFGSYHSATAAVSLTSVSGTATFTWFALGT